MRDMIKILEKQLEVEERSAKEKLTGANLDTMSRLWRRSYQ